MAWLVFQEVSMVISRIFSIFASQRYPHMKNNTLVKPKVVYQTPSLRLIEMNLEASFLASNLEPIGGGDDPDFDW